MAHEKIRFTAMVKYTAEKQNLVADVIKMCLSKIVTPPESRF